MVHTKENKSALYYKNTKALFTLEIPVYLEVKSSFLHNLSNHKEPMTSLCHRLYIKDFFFFFFDFDFIDLTMLKSLTGFGLLAYYVYLFVYL